MTPEPHQPLTPSSIRRHGSLLVLAALDVTAAAVVFEQGVSALRLPPSYVLTVLLFGYSLHGAVSTFAVLREQVYRWPRLLALHTVSLLVSVIGSYWLVRLTATVFARL